jgi:hypothetical protein
MYRAESREILKRFFEDRISRAECMAALDSALVALVPDLVPADLPAVQAILAENYRLLAENPGNNEFRDSAMETIPSPAGSPIEFAPWRNQ